MHTIPFRLSKIIIDRQYFKLGPALEPPHHVEGYIPMSRWWTMVMTWFYRMFIDSSAIHLLLSSFIQNNDMDLFWLDSDKTRSLPLCLWTEQHMFYRMGIDQKMKRYPQLIQSRSAHPLLEVYINLAHDLNEKIQSEVLVFCVDFHRKNVSFFTGGK